MLTTPNATRGRRARLWLECLEERISLTRDLLVSSEDRVLRYDWDTGAFVGVFASGGGLLGAENLVFGPDGHLYVSSNFSDSVKRYDGTTGAFIDTFASGGQLSRPIGLTFGPDGHLYVVSGGGGPTGTVKRYDGTTGAFLGDFISGCGRCTEVTFGPDGNLYVANLIRVDRYHGTTGASLGVFTSGSGLNSAWGLTFGPDGHLYATSSNDNQVKRYHGPTGAFLNTFATGGGLLGLLSARFGPDGNLYVASTNSHQIKRYDGTTGAFIDTFASGGGLMGPRSLTFFPESVVTGGPIIRNRTPQAVADVISSLRVTFDRAINPLTFTVADITDFTGQLGPIQPTAVTPVAGSNNTQFDISFPLQAITGLYGMTIGPNIADANGNLMDQDRDGVSGEFDDRYLAVFGSEGARVTAATMGNVGSGIDRIWLTFNRAMNPGTFVDWVGLQGPSGAIPLTGAAAVPNTGQRVIEVFFAPQTAPGRYTYTLLPGVRDVWGNPMDQNRNFIGGEIPGDEFVASFTIANAFSAVAPNYLGNVEGNSQNVFPFSMLGSGRYQQIYAQSQFPGGGIVDKIRFRRNGPFGSAFSVMGIDVQISLGYAARTVATASETFADNIGAGYVTVFDGLLSLSSAPSEEEPRPFDIVIDVADLFRYDPSQGDLLLDVRLRDGRLTTFFDAAGADQQLVTTRIYRLNVNEPTGVVGLVDGDNRPYGLVTQFDFGGGVGPSAGGPAGGTSAGAASLALPADARASTAGTLPEHGRERADAFFAAGADEPPRFGWTPAEEAVVPAAARRDGEAAGPLFELDLLSL